MNLPLCAPVREQSGQAFFKKRGVIEVNTSKLCASSQVGEITSCLESNLSRFVIGF